MGLIKQKVHDLVDRLFGHLVAREIAAAWRLGRKRDGYVIIGVPGSLGAALIASPSPTRPARPSWWCANAATCRSLAEATWR